MPRKYVFTVILPDDYLEDGQTIEQDLEDFANEKLLGSDLLGVAETDPDCKIELTIEEI